MANHRRPVGLYIDPPSHHFLGDRLFNANDGRMNGDHVNVPYEHLWQVCQAHNIEIHTADLMPQENGERTLVYVSTGILSNYRRIAQRKDAIVSAYFALECPVVEPSMFTEIPRAQKYFKRICSFSDSESLKPYVGAAVKIELVRYPQAFDHVHEDLWKRTERKFLVMINSNKLPRIYRSELYTERLRAVEFFHRTGDIDLYGVGWNDPPYRMGRTWMPYTLQRMHRKYLAYKHRLFPNRLLDVARSAYRGVAKSKSQTLGQYTFSLVIENMVLNGWITEKIFDCFYAGTVPIYWGAPDIEQYIPSDCYIDFRRFSGYAELRDYLKALRPAEIAQYRQNAREFLGSARFRPFSKEAFVETFCRIIEEDTDIKIQ